MSFQSKPSNYHYKEPENFSFRKSINTFDILNDQKNLNPTEQFSLLTNSNIHVDNEPEILSPGKINDVLEKINTLSNEDVCQKNFSEDTSIDKIFICQKTKLNNMPPLIKTAKSLLSPKNDQLVLSEKCHLNIKFEDKLQNKNVLNKKSETVNDMIFDEHNYSKISKCKKLSKKEKLSESSICVQKIQKLNPKEKSITNKLKWAYQNLKFFVLNVGGLKSKLKTEDIFESINSFHIVCFLEAKIDKVELEGLKNKFDGFELFANVEAEFSNKPRGGHHFTYQEGTIPIHNPLPQ